MDGVTHGKPDKRKYETHTPQYARRLYERKVEEILKAHPRGLTPGQVDELIFKGKEKP